MALSLQLQAEELVNSNNYIDASQIYEELISLEPHIREHYWNLGYIQLLLEREEDAQMTWMLALEQASKQSNLEKSSEEAEIWEEDLAGFLEKQAKKHEKLEQNQTAWLIRQYKRELKPDDLSNLFSIVTLSQALGSYDSRDLDSLGIIQILNHNREQDVKFKIIEEQQAQDQLIRIIEDILTYSSPDQITLDFLSICIFYLKNTPTTIQRLTDCSINICSMYSPYSATKVAEIILELDSDNLRILLCLFEFYRLDFKFDLSLITANRIYSLTTNSLAEKLFTTSVLLQALMVNCQNWDKIVQLCEEIRVLHPLLMNSSPQQLSLEETSYLLSIGGYFPYLEDRPQEAQIFRQQLHEFAQVRFNAEFDQTIQGYHLRNRVKQSLRLQNRPLKIGYLSSSLRSHSVGWLARSLFEYHDRSKFQLYGYFVGYNPKDPLQEWFASKVHKSYKGIKDARAQQIAQEISQDGIDILIDLDSITSVTCAQVLWFKPAPIQVTWLGWDAAGHPQVDYFIADPYTLPENAQDYYLESIWRLPHTFIAVDGFESAAPTISREQLGIPDDAVVYLSAQQSFKRNPEITKLQMQILRQVPNSYLLIKDSGEQNYNREFFNQIAKTENVDLDRLRFLAITKKEEEHRANLKIADVVLDTYPYNGATHTMETLWMEVPLVTLVGQQFAARNSYGMMMNAGITEGIAWTEAEYINWGIRLGTEPDLRKQVSLKLQQGKQTSPLWNAKQFTQDIESAYEQMWQKFQAPLIPIFSTESGNQDVVPLELFINSKAKQHNLAGISFAQQGELDQAIINFQTAIALQPNYTDTYYNLGIALSEKDDQKGAINNFKRAIELNPKHANAYYNLGLTYANQQKYSEAFTAYEKALAITPEDFDTILSLGNLHLEQRKLDEAYSYYQVAIELNPKSSEAWHSCGIVLTNQGKLKASISFFESALSIDANLPSPHFNLGLVYYKLAKYQESRAAFKKALELKPDFDEAYWSIVNGFSLLQQTDIQNYKFLDESVKQYLIHCREKSPIRTSLAFFSNCLVQGTTDQQAIAKLEELESFLYQNVEVISNLDISELYASFGFALPHLRDNLAKNSQILKLIGELYMRKILISISSSLEHDKEERALPQRQPSHPLRIGILSTHFYRHSMGWCSLDFIRELAKITPIYLYMTANPKPDDLTQQFEDIAAKFYRQETSFGNDIFVLDQTAIIKEILHDQIDILIDMDSVTETSHANILAAKPAPFCLIWLGFDTPRMDSEHYFLVDQHTHPTGVDQHYVEKLLRMPDSLAAISGLKCEQVDRSKARQSLGIGEEQVVYLAISPSRKLNAEMIKAQVQIIKNVPNSILLQRGLGYAEKVRELYEQEFNLQQIDINRYKFVAAEFPEEKHRAIYAIADVLLDSYPFNGGTLSLETLWFDLPMVTRVGEQFFSRMGYSFLTTLGISQGIATNWEEYIEWGIRFGIDHSLRESIKVKLIQSKQPETLSPLWNPQKFAQDFYLLLINLVSQTENRSMDIDYLQTAKDYLQVGNFELAAANCLKAIEEDPSLTEAYSQLGIIYAQMNDLDKAVAYFNQAIVIDPNFVDAYYNLGIALTQKSDLENAIASFEQAINLQPNNLDVYFNLGAVYRECQDLDSAAFCYQMALEIDPSYIDAYEHLINIYFSQKLFEEAIQYSQLALEQLNQKQAKEGDSDTEIFAIKSSIYQNIGSCFYQQNKFENALEAYRKAYSINPRLLDVESTIREIQWIIDIRSLTKKLPATSLDTCNKQLVLHVGCGTYASEKLHLAFRTPEWQEVRFDIDPDVKPDIIGTLTDMSAVESSSVAAIWSSHNIEHLYTHEVPIALKEFNRVLRFGGVVLVTCPNIQKVAEYVAKGKLENPLYSIGEEKDIPISALDILYGWGVAIASGNHFMAHRTGFTSETLRQKLLDSGFIDVVICREGLNLWARAYKPS